jgi:hypothetical protein
MRTHRIALVWCALASLSCDTGQPASPAEGDNAPDSSADGASLTEAAGCDRHLPSCPASPPSYAQAIVPIFNGRCVVCHYPGTTIARNSFSTYAKVYGDRGTVLDQIYGCVMPPAGSPPLTPAERATVLAWLECGAPDN